MTLFSRFRKKKFIPLYSFIQTEVLISLFLLVFSVTFATYGWSIYSKQMTILRAQNYLSQSVQQIANQMDAITIAWNQPSFFGPTHSSPIPDLSTSHYSATYSIESLASIYDIILPPNVAFLDPMVLVAKKTVHLDGVDFEQVYFFGYGYFRDQLIVARTMKIYAKTSI